ncbi:MAG: hypothetical protein JWN48_3180 [Myxococcaceae bacterium]|nr:hypothetical protein [Myxococcaceae bacterium]
MTEMHQGPTVVAVYAVHTSAESAVRKLQEAQLDLSCISLIGKGSRAEEQALGFYTDGEHVKCWGGHCATWTALMGVLSQSAFLFIPNIGPLVVMGPLVHRIVSTREFATAGDASRVLAAVFKTLGISEDRGSMYERELAAGSFLVTAHGPEALTARARSILGATDASYITTHEAIASRSAA